MRNQAKNVHVKELQNTGTHIKKINLILECPHMTSSHTVHGIIPKLSKNTQKQKSHIRSSKSHMIHHDDTSKQNQSLSPN